MITLIARTLVPLLLAVTALQAQVPQLINYQGRVAVGAVNFDGPGQFKFALVNGDGTKSYWNNDGTSAAGSEPSAAVTLAVTEGLYSVLLGDATLPNMTIVPATVFSNADMRLRVWFNDGTNGSQLLTPDQRIAAVGNALMAGNMLGGAITGAKIAASCVGGTQLINGAVGNAQVAANAAAVSTRSDANQSAKPSGGKESSAAEDAALLNAGYVRIASTVPFDAWHQRENGTPPSARSEHTVVWTGSEMIVWGGSGSGGLLNTGGRYNPSTNTWTTVSTSDAPAPRGSHTAVWTGGEMIVWGGQNSDGELRDGGRYHPEGNGWTPVSLSDAPAARTSHTAVWTGSEMIIWGGANVSDLNDGGRYNPLGNNWTAVSPTDAPSARNSHTAVWTGSEMIVWGGLNGATYLETGGRYNPAGNSWAPMTMTGAPAARSNHTAIWAGSEMIIWGGQGGNGGYFNDTFVYSPDYGAFGITNADLSTGNLIISFPTLTDRTYTLWRSDTLANGTWINTGLAALPGTGATVTFVVPATSPASGFFRVQADP